MPTSSKTACLLRLRRRLSPEEAAASKDSLEQVMPDSGLVLDIMEAFVERQAPPGQTAQCSDSLDGG